MKRFIYIHLLRHVSAEYYGHHQVVSQLYERKYIDVEASPLKTTNMS